MFRSDPIRAAILRDRLAAPFRRFARDEGGNVFAELVLTLPMMLWSYLALFVYWDGFRAVNTVQKASYTLSDMISREMVTIPANYVTGMDALMEYLIDNDQDVRLRVTSVTYDGVDEQFEVHWSRSPNNEITPLTTETLQFITNRIPTMADGDYVVIVETAVDYVPAFNVGMTDTTIQQFIVTRPRFVPRVCIADGPCS